MRRKEMTTYLKQKHFHKELNDACDNEGRLPALAPSHASQQREKYKEEIHQHNECPRQALCSLGHHC
jgi:hypothetical protein